MRFQTEVTVVFDTLEFQTLQRVEPSIRVGFPTDEIEALVRANAPASQIKDAKREWGGRHLAGVCSRRDLFTAEYVHAAWVELTHLIDVLAEQTDRGYWERVLLPEAVGSPERAEHAAVVGAAKATGVPLVASGVDVCRILAEAREGMLRDAQNAAPVLLEAVKGVGPVTERLTPGDLKSEGA